MLLISIGMCSMSPLQHNGTYAGDEWAKTMAADTGIGESHGLRCGSLILDGQEAPLGA